ncbi:YadA family autotransporter adhesin [Pseudomonas lactis]|uniref:YadA family autotransporter adhesin n=1 Tax=Pseudomonas lactis TaxID=1615674 RepID=UPI001F246A53|nr:YadA family autotransporter adhesin [Pseudomonas lactis]
MRGTKVLQLGSGIVGATSLDAVNGTELYNTANSAANAIGGGAQVSGVAGLITLPSFTTTILSTTGAVTGTNINTNVGSALSNLNTSLVNTAAVAVKYDNAGTKAQVTLNPGGSVTVLNNVAVGALNATSTNAINGSQLFSTNTTVNNLNNQLTSVTNTAAAGIKYDNVATKDKVTFNNGGASTALTNVAVGALNATSTDAVNGSQLFTTNTTVNNLNNQLTSVANAAAVGIKYDDAATKAKVTFNSGGAPTALANVAVGALNANSTDAVNGSQLFATNNSVTDLGTQLSDLATSAGAQEGNIANALGGGAAQDPTTGVWKAPTFTTATIDSNGAKTGTLDSNNVGDALTNLSDSLVNTAAVGVKYDDAGTKAKVTFNPGSTATLLSNVAAGTLDATSTDAINGSQLFATNNSVTDLGTQLSDLATSAGAQNGNIANALGGGAAQDPSTGIWKAPTFTTATIDGNGALTGTLDSNNVGDALTNLSDSLLNTAAVGVKYDDAGTKAKVTFNSGSTATLLSNVATGTLDATSTDAINGSQLFATNNSVTDLGTQLSDLATNAGAQNENIANALGGGAAQDQTTGVWKAPTFTTATIDGKGALTGTLNSNNVGDALTNLSDSLVNTAAVGVKYDDAGTKAKVTFNPGSTATLLSNVAAGTLDATSTDAVNGSQLFATNNSVTDLGTQLSDLATNAGAQNGNIANALGGGAAQDPTTGVWKAPTFTTATIDGNGALTGTLDSNNVGDALTNLSDSLVNTAAVGVKYDDTGTKAKVTLNPGSTATLLSNVAAGTLDANSTDAVNGSQLFATNNSVTDLGTQLSDLATNAGAQNGNIANALGGGAAQDPTTGVWKAPTFTTATIDGKGALTGTLDSNNVGDALTNINSSLVNSAAVGVKYDDAGTKAKVTFNPGSTATLLSNVAAGTLDATSTDAVNGSQLFATNNSVTDLGTQLSDLTTNAGAQNGNIANALGGGAAQDPTTGVWKAPTFTTATIDGKGALTGTLDSNNVGDALTNLSDSLVNTAAVGVKYDDVGTKAKVTFNNGGAPTALTNVAVGNLNATSTDVVNGSQLFATNTNVDNLGNQLNDLATTAGGQLSKLSEGLASTLGGGTQIDPATGAVTASTFTTTTIDGKGAVTGTLDSNNVGDALTNLNSSLVNTAAVGVKYDDAGTKAKVTFNNGGAPTALTNVAVGNLNATSTDVVNGSQLFATNTNVDNLGTQLSDLATSAGAQNGNIANALGGGAAQDPTTGVWKAPTFTTATIDGKGALTGTLDSNNVGDALTNLNSSLVNTAAVGVKYDDAGTKAKVTFNNGGTPTALTNVAVGSLSTTSTDAVNGSQLFATNNSVTDLGTQLSDLATSAGAQNGNIANALGGGAAQDPSTGVWKAPTFTTANIDNKGALTGTLDSNNVGDALTNINSSLVNTAAVGVKYDDAGTKAKVTFNPGSTATLLSNVAAGTLDATSTDAVNGSQLFATNTNVDSLGNQLNNLATAAGNQLSKLSEGLASTLGGGTQIDPVTGAVTAPTFTTTTIDGKGAVTGTLGSNNVGDALTNLSDSLANTAAVGVKYDDAGTKAKVTFNNGGTPTALANVAVGSLSATSTDAVNGSQLFATNTNVDNLGNQLSGLATNAGTQNANIANALGGGAALNPTTGVWTGPSFTTSTIDNTGAMTGTAVSNNVGDALTGLNNSLANTAAAAVKYDNAGDKTRVTFNPNGTSTTLSNVAGGTLSATSTEAVNGSQLFATNTNVTGLVTQLSNIVNSGSGIKYFHANSLKADSVASGSDAMALGPNAQASATSALALGNEATASGASSVAIGDGASATGAGNVAIGKAASDDQRGTETYIGQYSGAHNTTAGVVSVGNAATGEARVISNVADGKAPTDAINLRQLDGAVTESKHYTDTSLNKMKDTLGDVNGAVKDVSNQVANVEAQVSSVQKGTSGAFQVNNTRNAQPPKASGTNAVAGGMGAQASGNNSIAVGSNATASADNATATGNGAQASAKNSVALGANSVADRENSVAVGDYGSERQITHVAAGSQGSDAVNVDQLSRHVANATGNANAYTDQRIGDIKRDLKQQDSTLSAGIAGAMAMASLPRSSTSGGNMTSLAVGNYRGQSALAVGVSHVSENGRWSTNLMGTTNSQNDTGVAVGVGYQW